MQGTSDRRHIELQRADRAHRGLAGGCVLRSAAVRARTAAHLVSQLGVCRPLQRRCDAHAHSARSNWAIRRFCWCATTRACCKDFTTPAGIAARRCAARAAGMLRCRHHHLPVPRLGLQSAGRSAAHLLQGACAAASMSPTFRSTRSASGNGTASFSWRSPTSPPPFEKIFDLPLNRLDAWPLEDLIVGHVLQKTIECNWKIFWENYNECLHCPGVHPQLSQLVPIYGRGCSRSATIRSGARMPRTRIRSSRAACAAARRPGRWTAGSRAFRFPASRTRTASRATSI